jgi:BRO1-like domain
VLSVIQPSFSLFAVGSRRGPHYFGRCKTSERVLSGETQTRQPRKLTVVDVMSVTKSSAGTLSYLRTSAWHKLKASLSDEDGLPLDLSEAFLSSIESLMLAQAQECVWQWAVMGMITGLVSYHITLISKSRS